MGRELKRVPLNFDWKIGQIWSGYINPHSYHKCKHCDGMGYSKEYEKYQNLWYGKEKKEWKENPFNENGRYNTLAWNNNLTKEDVAALIEADRLWDFTRIPLNKEHEEIIKKQKAAGGNNWLPFNNGYIPTPEEVNEWNLKGMGHDSTNCWIVITARLKREGKPDLCPKCNGSGENWQSEKAKTLHENWENYEPPEGDGFQLWETTSDGSPKSLVFKTLDELCEWCAKNATTFADYKATKEEWIEMLNNNNFTHQIGNITVI